MPILPLKPKTVLNDRYEIEEMIGHGGFGNTYRAYDRNLDKYCVVKEFALDQICTRGTTNKTIIVIDGYELVIEKWLAKFIKEAKNLAKIDHQGVVTVFEVWKENGTVYYAMTLIEGGELPDPKKKAWKPMAWTEAKKIALALLKALQAVHKVGLLHGDIKPANILMDKESGLPILIDFGTARSLTKAKDKILTSLAYTVGYAPIELQDKERSQEVNFSSDLYSWAMVVIGLVAKHRDNGFPIDAKTRIMLSEVNADKYSEEFLQKWLTSLPNFVIAILASCLRLNSNQRPESASIILDQFENQSVILPESRTNTDENIIFKQSNVASIAVSEQISDPKAITILEINKNDSRTNIDEDENKNIIFFKQHKVVIAGILSILIVVFAFVFFKQTFKMKSSGETDEIIESKPDQVLCAENEYVRNHICISCAAGTRHEAGDNASFNDTLCEAIICDENEYVFNNICEPCASDSTNEAGDNASGQNTTCNSTFCAENEYVNNHICIPCAAGSINEAGDYALSQNTICEPTFCAENEYVNNHICISCAAGSTNEAGDNALSQGTICDSILCAENEYVSNHICIPCAAGSTNEANDEALGSNTICNSTFCAENEYVSNHICTHCSAGSTNEANDDASNRDTICDPILCAENEYVSNHICESCSAGLRNEAGDNASNRDTRCDPILCAENEYVSNHICESCSAGLRNGAGDDASRRNTSCENSVPAGFVRIPAGSFMMGSRSYETRREDGTWREDERRHEVRITRSFYMQRREVTQADWQALMNNNPSNFSRSGEGSTCGSNCPVENVNWWETLAYANALSRSENLRECYVLSGCNNSSPGNDMECSNASWTSGCSGYRLPTEAEWEYAARAASSTMFYSGDEMPNYIAWYGEDQLLGSTHRVGQLEANSWGLYDMSGNVREWCWDWYEEDYYNSFSSRTTNPTGPSSGSHRVFRGGAWNSLGSDVRSAARYHNNPNFQGSTYGFRLVSLAP